MAPLFGIIIRMKTKLIPAMLILASAFVMSAGATPTPVASVPAPVVTKAVIPCLSAADVYNLPYTRQKTDPVRTIHAEFDASGGGVVILVAPPEGPRADIPNDNVSRHYVLEALILPNVLPTSTNMRVFGVATFNPCTFGGLAINNVVVTITP